MNFLNWRKKAKAKEAAELENLRNENAKLRRTVESLMSKYGSSLQVGKLSLGELETGELEKLKTLTMVPSGIAPVESAELRDGVQLIEHGVLSSKGSAKSDGVKISESDASSSSSASSASASVSTIATSMSSSGDSGDTATPPTESVDKAETKDESPSPVIDAAYKSAVFVKSAQKDEVAVVDMDNVEWWTIVNPESLEEEKDITFEDSELGDSYAVINQDDVTESLANFVAVSIQRNPDAKQLTPAELKKVLDGTFAQMKKQGTLSSAYGWGMWLYSSYSWGSYIVRVYREPMMVKLIARAACVLYNQPMLIPIFAKGFWSAASWALVAYL